LAAVEETLSKDFPRPCLAHVCPFVAGLAWAAFPLERQPSAAPANTPAPSDITTITFEGGGIAQQAPAAVGRLVLALRNGIARAFTG
jgi:hypothetical protein